MTTWLSCGHPGCHKAVREYIGADDPRNELGQRQEHWPYSTDRKAGEPGVDHACCTRRHCKPS